MSGADENADRRLEQRAKALFDESVSELDAQTRSRLAQARHAALSGLEPMPAARAWRAWVPAAGLAAAALAAVGISLFKSRDEQRVAKSSRDASWEDLDLLASDDDLELMEDLDFYSWIDSADGKNS